MGGIGLALGLGIGAGGKVGWSAGSPPLNNYAGFVGDSITVAASPSFGSTTVRLVDSSAMTGAYATWACILPTTDALGASGKLVFAGCAGASGQQIAAIRTTYWPLMRDAVTKRGIVVFLAGTNDLSSTSPGGVLNQSILDGRMADLTAMWDQAMANGQMPVACSLPPSGTANNRPAVIAYRDAIATAAAARGIPYANLYASVGDGETGAWLNAGDNTDGIHPSNAGAKKMGQALRDALEPYLLSSPWPRLVTTGDDTTGWAWLGGRMDRDDNANGRAWGGGLASGEDAYGAASNASHALVAEGGVVDGNWFRTTKTASNATNSLGTGPSTGNYPIPVATGQVYEVAFKFKWDGDNDNVSPGVTLVDTGGTHNTIAFTAFGQGDPAMGPYTLSALVTVPGVVNSLARWVIGVTVISTGGLGVIHLGQLSVRRIA